MSTLALVEVIKCDGVRCEQIAVVQTETDRESFYANWFGISTHFCPDCRDKVENAGAVSAEESLILELTEGTECALEYAREIWDKEKTNA